jgi:hypothetical protein
MGFGTIEDGVFFLSPTLPSPMFAKEFIMLIEILNLECLK